jgi:hypothetical protein
MLDSTMEVVEQEHNRNITECPGDGFGSLQTRPSNCKQRGVSATVSSILSWEIGINQISSQLSMRSHHCGRTHDAVCVGPLAAAPDLLALDVELSRPCGGKAGGR